MMTFNEACDTYRARKSDQFEAASEAVVSFARDNALRPREAAALAEAMALSGEQLSVPASLRPLADVPSTGGPASLTTLLCPLLLAALGDYVPKLSATGSVAGGIDTMAVIPGFQSDLKGADFLSVLLNARFAHAEPSENFCPADRYLINVRRKASMMANAGLAAASLLAKKAAIPGVACAFDFRVGPSGNIGATPVEARQAAKLFRRVAESLRIKIDVVLTNNESFPCSALGRLESLNLLWAILAGDDNLLRLDQEHLELCVELAVRAHALVDQSAPPDSIRQRVWVAVASGAVRETLMSHLDFQGASEGGLRQVLKTRETHLKQTITVAANGYWLPPSVDVSKTYIKKWQSKMTSRLGFGGHNEAPSADAQVGLQLLVSPGDEVYAGQPVLELRFPRQGEPDDVPSLLAGSVVPEPPVLKPQLIAD